VEKKRGNNWGINKIDQGYQAVFKLKGLVA